MQKAKALAPKFLKHLLSTLPVLILLAIFVSACEIVYQIWKTNGTIVTMDILQNYYSLFKSRLDKVVYALNKTPYGIKNKFKSYELYSEFANRISFSEDILKSAPRSIIIKGDRQLRKFTTSGTTGTQKIIYVPNRVNLDVVPHQVIDTIKSQNNPLFVGIHSKRTKNEYVYWVYKKIYGYHCPRFTVREFYDSKTVINSISKSDFLIIYDYPSSIQHLLYFLSEYLKNNPKSKNRFNKKMVVIELFGEPIKMIDLNIIFNNAKDLFGIEPIIWVSYGLTEVGSVGLYEYKQNGKGLWYSISSNIFLEILDVNNYRPVPLGKIGEIVVSSLRTEGTILLRYRTKDLGRLLVRNNRLYLQVLGRDPKTMTIYVAGGQFSVIDLRNYVVQQFGILPKFDIAKKVVSKIGQELLRIYIYLPSKVDQEKAEKLKESIMRWIIAEAMIQSEIRENRVTIFVGIRPYSSGPKKVFKLS